MTDETPAPTEPAPAVETQEPILETLGSEIKSEGGSPALEVPTEAPPAEEASIPEVIAEPASQSTLQADEGFTKPLMETHATAESSPVPTESLNASSQTPPSSPPTTSLPAPPHITTRRGAAFEKRMMKKKARLEKVVALARERRKISNNDVQILLGVSDATASRYLRQLAQTGRLTRVGKQKRPFYEPA